MLNSSELNSVALNGASGAESVDWEALAPVERQRVFVLDIGTLRIPISSAQATMRLSGQSFLQVVVPNGGEYVDDLAELPGSAMLLRSGYRYADGSLSPLEAIASAPFQLLRRDEGPSSDTLTLSGYGELSAPGSSVRHLRGIQYRSTAATGRRRVRSMIDLFLRPGHTAIDGDDTEFTAGIIQYFIGARSEFMEVIEHG